MTGLRVFAAFVLMVASLGCDRPLGRGGGPSLHDVAAGRIAGARCARFDRCAEIGRGSRYTDALACQNAELTLSLQALDVSTCSQGVVPQKLEQCLEAIRFDDCGEVSSLPACDARSLCGR